MPVQYGTGVLAEHHAVRKAAGLFDLGHMGQVNVSGPDALEFLQRNTTNDASKLEPGQAQYSLLPTEAGTAIDDILVYRAPEGASAEFGPAGEAPYYVVVNASNAQRDVAWLQSQRVASALDVTVEDVSDRTGMIAIQGPSAVAIVQQLTDANLDAIGNYRWGPATVAGVPLMLARTGYTGEDGFELFPPIDQTEAIWTALLAAGQEHGCIPIGLGARDTLRLEARMPLYGQELGEDISPYEAGVSWAVKLGKGDFVGRDAMAAVKEAGAKRKTVGFQLVERSGAPRSHYPVQVDGREVGYVTSGAFSPTLGANIGLALVDADVAGVGRPLQIVIRGRAVAAEQIPVPFYKREK
jgi:aminomethyltransferase